MWGKTVAGLGIVHKLKQKTLIITTTTTIRDMWIKEVRKWFGIEPGVIGGGKFNIDSPIVVGNIQTVRNKAQEISKEFGLVLVDEVHRAVAATFTSTLSTMKNKYTVGLSGTMKRKDGMHCIMQDYFGFTKFVGVQENTLDPEIHLHQSEIELTANEYIPWANKVTAIMSNPKYRDHIITLSRAYAEAGHKVLVLCDRTELLEYGHFATEDISVIITGSIKGVENRQQIMDAVANGPAQILWGTQSIFSEGVSLNELSAVILATPISNDPLLEQIVGRVMRKARGKKTPVVVDIAFRGNTGKRQRNSRMKFYMNKGWAIRDFS